MAEYTKLAARGSVELNSKTMHRLIRDANLTPPIGASPGELKLWMKKNGLLDALAAEREDKQPVPRPPPAASARTKAAGKAGSLAARRVEPVKPAPVAQDPAAAVHTDALDEFAKEQAAQIQRQAAHFQRQAAQKAPVHSYDAAASYDAAGAQSYADAMPQRAPFAVGGAIQQAAAAADPHAYARLFSMQVQMQQMALMQQQWQMYHQQMGQQRSHWMQQGARAAQYDAEPYHHHYHGYGGASGLYG